MMRKLAVIALSSLWVAQVRAQDAGVAGTPDPVAAEPAPPPAAVTDPAPSTPNAVPGETSTPAPAAAAPEEALMTAAELEALGMNMNQAGVDTSFQFSGFADFSLAASLVPKDSIWRAVGVSPSHSTFYVGNLNLYLKKNLTETLRTMGEVRVTYLPNGSFDFVRGTRTSTSTMDYSDYGRAMRWGGVEIERIYLEWSMHPLLAVRAGQFLTPYGIWNVDHGSPTYIPVQRPFVIGNSWFPERQTGLELFGRWDGGKSTVGYHLTLSNGTGPVSEYSDLDENKAIGARLSWDYRGLGDFHLGGSVYWGRETSAISTIVPGPEFATSEKIETQFDSLAWGADASWKYKGLHLQSEWITYQRAYTRKGRTAPPPFGGGPSGFFVDEFSWGMYVLAGYRFSWLGVMPFIVFEHIDGIVQIRARNATYQVGLNVRPVDVLALKVVYYHVDFFTGGNKDDPLRMVQAQVAWAF